MKKLKLLIFIVAYNAETTIFNVLTKVIGNIHNKYDTDILILDDSSADGTFKKSIKFANLHSDVKIITIRNPENQGYGGNQKLGYNYAIKYGYDVVVLLHGDGQYAPEYLFNMVEPIAANEADAVFGSRMLKAFDALRGGMPLYKFIGNKILTMFQNMLMNSKLSEWHSGYRAYSVRTLSTLPFERNDNGFSFDTDIILQLMQLGARIKEIPIPTFYGEEICYVNGILYAIDICINTLKCKLHNMNLFYERKYDCHYSTKFYNLKLGYPSSHSFALSEVKDNSMVLDIGCGAGLLTKELKRKKCCVVGIDQYDYQCEADFDIFIKCQLTSGDLPWDDKYQFDYALLLDVIEHIFEPEIFLDNLRNRLQYKDDKKCTLIVTSPNVAFIVNRILLLIGRFNYVKRGILDMTHIRLFTFSSLKKIFIQSGYKIISIKGVPAPFPEVIHNRFLSLALVRINQLLILFSKSLFSYQIMIKAIPYSMVDLLLAKSVEHSRELLDNLSKIENEVNS